MGCWIGAVGNGFWRLARSVRSGIDCAGCDVGSTGYELKASVVLSLLGTAFRVGVP